MFQYLPNSIVFHELCMLAAAAKSPAKFKSTKFKNGNSKTDTNSKSSFKLPALVNSNSAGGPSLDKFADKTGRISCELLRVTPSQLNDHSLSDSDKPSTSDSCTPSNFPKCNSNLKLSPIFSMFLPSTEDDQESDSAKVLELIHSSVNELRNYDSAFREKIHNILLTPPNSYGTESDVGCDNDSESAAVSAENCKDTDSCSQEPEASELFQSGACTAAVVDVARHVLQITVEMR